MAVPPTIDERPAVGAAEPWAQFPAPWGAYRRILRARGERGRPRYVFFDGRLTVVSPGHAHEWLKTRLVALLDEVLVGLGIDFHASGSVTLLRTSRPRSGVEGDASYYLTNIDRVRGRSDLVMGRDPAPDLMIEVVIAHPEHDALEVYRRLGVREVWVCRRHALEFLVLSEGGDYVEAAASAVLPFLTSEELAPWVFRDDLASDAPLRRQFRDWVAATLAPRRGGRNA